MDEKIKRSYIAGAVNAVILTLGIVSKFKGYLEFSPIPWKPAMLNTILIVVGSVGLLVSLYSIIKLKK